VRRIWTTVFLAGLLVLPASAEAHETVREDGNDTRGPLDLSVVSVGHSGETAVTHTLRTFEPWKAKDLKGGSYLVVAFDVGGDDSDFERCAFAFFRSRLRGRLTNCGRRRLSNVMVHRSNGRSVTFTVGLEKLLGEDGGDYRWVAFSFYRNDHACSDACGDSVPNHLPELFHDLTPPMVTLRSFPDPSTDTSASTSFPVEFGVSDHGGSGVRSWKLRRRRVGGIGWTHVAHGVEAGHQSVEVDANQGHRYEFQVIVVDRQGNRSASTPEDARVTVPFDDQHPSIVYTGSWTTPPTGNALYFRSTRHVSTTPNDTATFAFTGRELRIIGGTPASEFTVFVDDDPAETFSTTGQTQKRSVVAHMSTSAGDHTAEITVESGTFVLDGYAASSY
jgi:hypothetical protein